MPAGSKRDLPLAKAEPSSDGDSTSMTTYLRKGKKPAQLQPEERHVGACERTHADTKFSEEGVAGGAPGAREELPLQPVMETLMRQAEPLQLMEAHGGADPHLQLVEDPTPEQVDARRRL